MDWSQQSHDILYYNAFFSAPAWLRYANFDAVIFHTTFLCMRWNDAFYKWKCGLRWVADLDCLKIALPQDEYDHSEILDEWLDEWGVLVIFSIFDRQHHETLYPIMHKKADLYRAFTGYIDENISERWAGKIPTLEERSNDIVYRATRLPYWFGHHGQMKYHIAERVRERAIRRGMKCDISTQPEDTIVGDQWEQFMASGRAVIGCESGSSVLDRRGEIQARIQARLRMNPALSFEEIQKELPSNWDSYKFFAIGPRHFEAVITKTCQVLVEGWYDGIFQPDKHYIPLKRDYSNLDEVLDKLRDLRLMNEIVEQAHRDICLSGKYSYRVFASTIDGVLSRIPESKARRYSGSEKFMSAVGYAAVKGAITVRQFLQDKTSFSM